MTSIAVIGAGLSGLAAARSLQNAGAGVTVFERETEVGGRMSTDELDGYRIDTGAQLFGSMYVNFFELARDAGLGQQLVRVDGRDALWRDGRPHEVVYGSVASMIASVGLPFRTKLRLGSSYVPFLAKHSGSLDIHSPERCSAAGLDSESIAVWGEREVGKDFIDSLVYPQLGAYYGGLPEETSAGFYHILAKHGMDVKLYALRGGAGTLPTALAEAVRTSGGEILTSTAVRTVVADGAGVRVGTEDGERSFDGAIVAIPAPLARSVVGELPESMAAWLDGVRFRPMLTLALLLDQAAGPRYFGMSYPRGTTSSVVAITLQENKQAALVPENRGLVVAFPTPEVAASLLEMESREILDRMLPEVARAIPGVESRILRARVYRWPVGMPAMYPGYLGHLGRFRSGGIEPDAPIAFAGDYLYGPSVEGAVTSGQTASARLLGRVG